MRLHSFEVFINKRTGGTDNRQAYIISIVLLVGVLMSLFGVPLHLTGIVGIQEYPPY